MAKAYTVKEKREKRPNAYKHWAESDDRELKKRYRPSLVNQLADVFGRGRGAIKARIHHFLDEKHDLYDPEFFADVIGGIVKKK